MLRFLIIAKVGLFTEIRKFCEHYLHRASKKVKVNVKVNVIVIVIVSVIVKSPPLHTASSFPAQCRKSSVCP